MLKYVVIALLATGSSWLLTPVDRMVAIRIGAIDHPGARRVHKLPRPRLGGPAILLAVAAGLFGASFLDRFVASALKNHETQLVALAIAAAMVTLVGAIDDRVSLRPLVKLGVEIVAASLAVAAGYRVQMILGFHLGSLGFAVSVLCFLVVINATNMIDGLDGLAAGLSLIISTTLLVLCVMTGEIGAALLLAALAGALLGFLPYNFHPARIFLGDSGSLLLGFLLAASMIGTTHKMEGAVAYCAPFLALGLPLTELGLTTMRRILRAVYVIRDRSDSGRYEFRLRKRPSLFTADRNHIHHRLLTFGFSHRNAVLALYAANIAFCLCALAVARHPHVGIDILLAAVAVVPMVAARGLRYRELRVLRGGLFLPLFDVSEANRRIAQVIIDLSIIVVSYLAAYSIRFGFNYPGMKGDIIRDLPVIVCAQLLPLMIFGVYRLSFRNAALPDMIVLTKAIAVGVAATCAGIELVQGGVRLSVLIPDACILACLLGGARLSFSILDYTFRRERPGHRRTMIYGADQHGRAALQYIKNQPALDMKVVGFIAAVMVRSYDLLNGLRVYSVEQIAKMAEKQELDSIVIARNRNGTVDPRLLELCRAHDIAVWSFAVQLRREDLDSVATQDDTQAKPGITALLVG